MTLRGDGVALGAGWLAMGRGWVASLGGSTVVRAASAEQSAVPLPSLLRGAACWCSRSRRCCTTCSVAFDGLARRRAPRARDRRSLAREAELRALRAQIDPHFLFNSLNSISALIGSDPQAARRMCLLLAEFLRKSLALGARQAIALGRGAGPRPRASWPSSRCASASACGVESEVDRGRAEPAVPPLLLQPLVENAVRHGIAQLLEGGTCASRRSATSAASAASR